MKIFRSCLRCRYISICLIFITLLSCLIVPAAAAPTSDDGIISGLLSGWSNTTSPLYFNTSWFWQVIVELRDIDTTLSDTFSDLKSGWTGTTLTTPTGYSNSWYASVRNLLYGIDGNLDLIQPAVTNIDLDLDTVELKTSSIENYVSNYLPGLASNIGKIQTSAATINSSLSLIKSDISDLDSNLSSLCARFIETAIQIDYIEDHTLLTATLLDVLNDTSHSTYLEIFDVRKGMDKLVDVFASEEDIALKNKTKDSVSAVISSVPSTSSSISSLFGLSDFLSFGEVEPISFSELSDYLFGVMVPSWFSEQTASYFAVNGGASTFALTPDSSNATPLYDANYDSIKNWSVFDG